MDAGVTGIVNAFSPCLLIMVGGIVAAVPELVDSMEQTLRDPALAADVEQLRVVRAALGLTRA